ncbi:hypothetical protein [Flavobacterium sp. ASW18X]|uniref:hypothetical protein n=1 Tax=Flavobacterium sp. ASW18X TaxID=2572595 RepID=UPI0010AE7F0C|nr:hypothetical protein [Flavobacterium sp. ASW18X]TKD66130.1 hypothetical protein FBT53_04465 [Flavobacterium sp. ASW18X]
MKKNKSSKETKIRFLFESILIILIILSPFIYKLHEATPFNPEVESINILGINIYKSGFPSIQSHIWFLLSKAIPFYLLMIWFLTCKEWWYHILLIPLLMYAFQIFEIYIGENSSEIADSSNVIWLLPICVIIIPFVYLIRTKLYDKYVHGIDLKAMDEELKFLEEKKALRKEWEKLEEEKAALLKKM